MIPEERKKKHKRVTPLSVIRRLKTSIAKSYKRTVGRYVLYRYAKFQNSEPKQKKKKPTARTVINACAAVILVAVIALLGVYASGLLDGGDLHMVDNVEYTEGGFSFSGGLKDGYFSESGTIYYEDGGIYRGGFIDGRFDGEAVYTHYDNESNDFWQFDGFFADGQISSGVFQLRDGTIVAYENGQNTRTLISPTWQYDGGVNERGQNGSGRFVFEDGSVYSGDFMNGSAFGEGVLVDAAGNTVYFGEFLNGCFDGQGVYYSPEGWIYQGGFKDGLFEGGGILFMDDIVITGVWKEGVQVSRND